MNAAFRSRLGDYGSLSESDILGQLIAAAARLGFSTHQTKQTEAWQGQIRFLRGFVERAMRQLPASKNWRLLFEFEIPRRGKRPDIILLADDLIFILEFKVGASDFSGGGEWQVLSYALDLRDFHQGSLNRTIVPILVATQATNDNSCDEPIDIVAKSHVLAVQFVGDANGDTTAETVIRLYSKIRDANAPSIDAEAWEKAPYRPTPTIIEAAERLFAGHSVTEISHAFATNLDVTCAELLKAIENAHLKQQRTICFVTGTPGAGKTLTGLNTVHSSSVRSDGRPSAIFLSGNGPLVKIVRAALVRDQQRTGSTAKLAARRTVATFIDNVHRFISTYGLRGRTDPPHENAIVFDEAQRAWDATAVFKAHSVLRSEPDLVLEIMERAPNWSVIIALVGEGQEIHRGEAGLAEWGRALNERKVAWNVLASPAVLENDGSGAGQRLFLGPTHSHLFVTPSPSLHLNVSVRSPRAKRIGEWVNSLLTPNSEVESLLALTAGEFPIVLTRDLSAARKWLREKSDGNQRAGLLASSGALRLRSDGIEVSSAFRGAYSYEDWFLSGIDDTRSSSWLEVAATEFECQGLELDWTGVCWGGDFLMSPDSNLWKYRKFRGAKWQMVRKPDEIQFVKNKYRVLLTRARKGMVIWVPRGDSCDETRSPEDLDATAKYIESRGVPRLQ